MKALLPGLLLIALTLPALRAAEAAAPGKIQVETLVQSTKSWDGTPLPPFPAGAQPEMRVVRITIPPHTSLPVHKHPVYNAGVLLKGSLVVELVGGPNDGKTMTMKAGDPLVEVMNQWHYGRNDGDEPAEILVVYTGPKGTPITVLKDDQPNKSGY